MRNGISPGYAISQNSAKMGVPLQVYALKIENEYDQEIPQSQTANHVILNHVILVDKCKL